MPEASEADVQKQVEQAMSLVKEMMKLKEMRKPKI